jgi:hypothetical protein
VNDPSDPDSFPIGVLADEAMTEPGIVNLPLTTAGYRMVAPGRAVVPRPGTGSTAARASWMALGVTIRKAASSTTTSTPLHRKN